MLFDGFDATLIATFGEAAMENPLPIFFPDTSDEQEADGIVSQTAPTEESVPGNVTRLFVRLADLSRPPERREVVEVRTVRFSIDDLRADDIGGMQLILRKK